MTGLLQDVRSAAWTLRKSPGFTLLAVVCLGIGIGANTVVFTAVNTLLLRPLPFTDPDRVMLLHTLRPDRDTEDPENFSYPEYLDWTAQARAFSGTGAFTNTRVNLGGVDEPERVPGSRITASLFPMLGLRPSFGRTFRPEEDESGRVVILSHALWQRRFGGERDAVGRTVTINGEPHTVVGVMQPGIRFPEVAELWLPIAPGEARNARGWRQYEVLARLKPGVTLEQARTEAAAIARQQAERYPDTNAARGGWLQPYRELFARVVRPMMLIMLGAVGFVLLIACANVANLLVARGVDRQREIAVRSALGAARWRIVRQLLAESALIALLGGVVGALIGTWGMAAIARSLPAVLPFWMVFEVDRTVLLVTFTVSLASVAVFGLVPSLHASAPDLTRALKEGSGRGATAGARTGRLRGALVVTQLVLSLVLLVGATLMIRSFLRLQGADPGFRTERLLTFETSLQGARYDADDVLARTYGEILRRIEALPGVERAGATSQLPIDECCSSSTYYPEDAQYTPADAPAALHSAVTPSYFGAMGIPLLGGRGFDERDIDGAPCVVVVNRTLAEREWPGESPLGRRIRYGPSDTLWFTVVGVVQDVKQRHLSDPDRPQMYVPLEQQPHRSMSVAIRTRTDPVAAAPAVRAAVHAVDANLPLAELRTMERVVHDRIFDSRIYSAMFGVFAVAALLLASIGLYGVMVYAVAQRTHEIGVRVALGARHTDVVRLVVGGAARLVGVGLLIGIPAALGLARVLQGALYGVSASDPATFVGIPLLLTGVALLASYVPARRATRVDPVEALRAE